MNVTDLRGTTVAFLASGGLDSCTITRWLTDNGVRVVSFTADLGQPDEEDLDEVAERMRGCGAVEAHVVPLVEEMAEAGIIAVQAQARYEGGYWNTTPLARYVTVRGVLPRALDAGVRVLSHGATGRGNDQVRFQLATAMLAPDLPVYAPWRDQMFLDAFGGREEMIAYCAERGVPLKPKAPAEYSTDANLLGLTHEAGALESLTTPASFVDPEMGVRATEAPDAPRSVTIRFERGRPVTVDGRPCADAATAFRLANELGGAHGVGIGLHLVENRFVGIKSRGIYEAPGMELLGPAYAYLLDFCSVTWAEQCYQAYGEDLGSALVQGVVAQVAALATGTVTVSCYKGTVGFVSLTDTPHSLYSEADSSMARTEGFDHRDSEGFVRVLGVGARAAASAGQVPEPLR
jgi:argininosuccinate synthase